jgi:hypothetical protein
MTDPERIIIDALNMLVDLKDRAATWKARAVWAEARVLPPQPTDAMLEAMWEAMFEEPFDATSLPMLAAGYDALRAALEDKP